MLVKERAQDAVILIAGIAGAGEEEQLRGRIGQRVGKGGGCGFDCGGILVRNGNAVGLRGDSRIVGDEVHADAAALQRGADALGGVLHGGLAGES